MRRAMAVLGVVVVACSPAPSGDTIPPVTSGPAPVPAAPSVPEGPLDPAVADELDGLLSALIVGNVEPEAFDRIAAGGDARVAWYLADLLRFVQSGPTADRITATFERLTGASLDEPSRPAFVPATEQLLAWDLPAWPEYRTQKAKLFLEVDERWAPFFEDADSAIDWRPVTWGGVLIDDRPLGNDGPCPRGCIPALDDPATTDPAGGDWYADDRVVFGVVVGGEALALPKHQMEVHEMVNLTLGGRRLGIPYCTLCGSAQAYLTDTLGEEPLVLRTSGLLTRSNKMMFDLGTWSMIDTFTGQATSGPLHDREVTLEQVTVVASTWGEWRRRHPDTRILAEDGGVGLTYPDDPLGGRDDEGPIFPVGPVDPRLGVQEAVVGVIDPEGTPVAFPVDEARAALERGEAVGVGELRVELDGDGLRVFSGDRELPAHQAFWFAWSQFHPGTVVWTPG